MSAVTFQPTNFQFESYLEKLKKNCMDTYKIFFTTKEKVNSVFFSVLFSIHSVSSTSLTDLYFTVEPSLKSAPEEAKLSQCIDENIFLPLRKKLEEKPFPPVSAIKFKIRILNAKKDINESKVSECFLVITPSSEQAYSQQSYLSGKDPESFSKGSLQAPASFEDISDGGCATQ